MRGEGRYVRRSIFSCFEVRVPSIHTHSFSTQSQENNEDVWGQFVSITPNTSQVDVRSLDGNIKRSEIRKRRDTELSETEMVVGSPVRGDETSLEYKLPPGDDYSFSDCIISSPETKSASKLSERVSPNLRPYRVQNHNNRGSPVGRVTRRHQRGMKNSNDSHVRSICLSVSHTQ